MERTYTYRLLICRPSKALYDDAIMAVWRVKGMTCGRARHAHAPSEPKVAKGSAVLLPQVLARSKVYTEKDDQPKGR